MLKEIINHTMTHISDDKFEEYDEIDKDILAVYLSDDIDIKYETIRFTIEISKTKEDLIERLEKLETLKMKG